MLGNPRKILQDPLKCYEFLGDAGIIHRKIWHDPSECYKFLGNLGTIQATCLPVSLEYLQDPSKCYDFLGDVESST